jgi:hypothetical protein
MTEAMPAVSARIERGKPIANANPIFI